VESGAYRDTVTFWSKGLKFKIMTFSQDIFTGSYGPAVSQYWKLVPCFTMRILGIITEIGAGCARRQE
jgi:hypothetical protein